MNSPTLQLSTNLRIRPLTRHEKYFSYFDQNSNGQAIGNGWGRMSEGENTYFDDTFFAVDCVGSSKEQVRYETLRLAACFLLFQPSATNDQLARIELGPLGFDFNPSGLPALPNDRINISLKQPRKDWVFLDQGDVSNFKHFWQQMATPTWPTEVMFAGRRLLRAQEKNTFEQQEDRLIDLMIICEAVIMLGNERGAKSVKVSGRMGKLQNDPPNLTTDNGLFRLAYLLRNDVLHTGTFSQGNLNQLPNPAAPSVDALLNFLAMIEERIRIGLTNYITQINSGLNKIQIVRNLGQFCVNCVTALPAGTRFCHRCGTRQP